MENNKNWGLCEECGKYHENPVRKHNTFEQDVVKLLSYEENLEKEIANLKLENKKLYSILEEADFAANHHNDDDIAELLAYSEALENANNENLATVEVLERELYDARRDLELARAELRIAKLEAELEKRKSAKWDKNPWPGYAYDPVWKNYQVGDTFDWGTISSTNATVDPEATKAHYTYCEDE